MPFYDVWNSFGKQPESLGCQTDSADHSVKAAVKIEKILFKFLKREIPDIVALKKALRYLVFAVKWGNSARKKGIDFAEKAVILL